MVLNEEQRSIMNDLNFKMRPYGGIPLMEIGEPFDDDSFAKLVDVTRQAIKEQSQEPYVIAYSIHTNENTLY